MRVGIPQIIWLVLAVLSVGIALAKNGERKKENYSFFTALIATIIEIIILSYGGFFK